MSAPVFIINTSCLTQAHRVYYPFDIAPSFWGFMQQHFTDGDFIITNKVVDEIKKGKDELTNWVQSYLLSKELTVILMQTSWHTMDALCLGEIIIGNTIH